MAMRHLNGEGDSLDEIVHGIERDLKNVRGTLLDVQRLYSEIAASITTVVASRTVLNKQRLAIEELHHEGLLDIVEYKKIRGAVEFNMKKLTTHPPLIALPQKLDILRQIPWLSGFDEEQMTEISASFKDVIFQRGDLLVEENDLSDSVHVLARGTVVVIGTFSSTGAPVEIDELGMGTVFGEIAWALKCPRLASIKATSPGLLFTISGDDLRRLSKSNKELENRLWQTCGYRLGANILAQNSNNSRRKIREVVHDMTLYHIEPTKKNISFHNDGYVILLQGVAIVYDDSRGSKEVIEAPDIISGLATSGNILYSVEFSTNSKYMCHPLSIAIDLETTETKFDPCSKITSEKSMDDLELKAVKSSSRELMTIDDLGFESDQLRFKRRYSTPIVHRGSLGRTGASKVFARRSTAIAIGSNYDTVDDEEEEHSDSSSDLRVVKEVV